MDEQIKKICVFYDTKTGFALTKACKIKGIKHYSFNQTNGYNLSFIHLSDADLTVDYLKYKISLWTTRLYILNGRMKTTGQA